LTVYRGEESHSSTKTIPINGSCVNSASKLCLHSGRIEVTVDFESEGEIKPGQTRPERSNNSGLFWFFAQSNIELLVKVLNGCSVNDHYWVLTAGTTNLPYQIRVRDTFTDQVYVIENAGGEPAPARAELEALAICDAAASGAPQVSELRHDGSPIPISEWAALRASASGDALRSGLETAFCPESKDTLCLLGSRYRINLDWEDGSGKVGKAQPVALDSPDSGLYTFFDPANWEMVAKVINGCSLNGKIWVFAAATTNVGYTLRITDMETGEQRLYENPVGTLAPATIDIDAFSAQCDATP
jgi:hypothetical protein